MFLGYILFQHNPGCFNNLADSHKAYKNNQKMKKTFKIIAHNPFY